MRPLKTDSYYLYKPKDQTYIFRYVGIFEEPYYLDATENIHLFEYLINTYPVYMALTEDQIAEVHDAPPFLIAFYDLP